MRKLVKGKHVAVTYSLIYKNFPHFLIPQACLFRTDFEPKAHHVKESNHCITDTEI